MKRVGILGGGQLARMLIIEGFKMGLEMHVMSLHANDPAAQVTRFWHEGDVTNADHLTAFFKQVDVVTIESEFMDETTLTRASLSTETPVSPHPELLALFSDRLTQKKWLEDNKIPTAPFAHFRNADDVIEFFKRHRAVVMKTRRFGYDGYGTFIIRSRADLDRFLAEHEANLVDFIGEELIPFRRELAVQFAVNRSRQVMRYPLVEWHAENSRCLWVKGPARRTDTKAVEPLMTRIERALKAASSSGVNLSGVNFQGVMAFELFEVTSRQPKRSLVVNEVAPRVHNSGHYTLEATAINQFQAHLRAILNLPLPKKPEMWSPGFAMWNLLGPADAEKNSPASPTVQPRVDFSDVQLHWYGKTEIRSGRKMGHLTTLASTGNVALKKLERAASAISALSAISAIRKSK